MQITEIDPQRNERLRDGGDDGGVWIRHGIQQLAADSVILLDIDEKQPPLLPSAMDGRVPVTLPGDSMLLDGGHERIRSSTQHTLTNCADLIANCAAAGRTRGGGTIDVRGDTGDAGWPQRGHTRRESGRTVAS
jgi:hypothetical protein